LFSPFPFPHAEGLSRPYFCALSSCGGFCPPFLDVPPLQPSSSSQCSSSRSVIGYSIYFRAGGFAFYRAFLLTGWPDREGYPKQFCLASCVAASFPLGTLLEECVTASFDFSLSADGPTDSLAEPFTPLFFALLFPVCRSAESFR